MTITIKNDIVTFTPIIYDKNNKIICPLCKNILKGLSVTIYKCNNCNLNYNIEQNKISTKLHPINQMRLRIKQDLNKVFEEKRKITINLYNEFKGKLKSLETSVETITEEGTKHTGQYIGLDDIYDLIDEYEEKIKELNILL